jgi:hypothetical protein
MVAYDSDSNLALEERHQARLIRKRKGVQQHRIRTAEDRGVGANAECDRHHGNRRESRILSDHPGAVTHVLPEVRHDIASAVGA